MIPHSRRPIMRSSSLFVIQTIDLVLEIVITLLELYH